MTPLAQKILPVNFEEATSGRIMVNSSGYVLSDGLLLEDATTYKFDSPNYEGTFELTIVVEGLFVALCSIARVIF